MKNKYIVTLLLIGIIITIIGMLFKIMHWPGGAICLISGAGLKIASLVMLINKLLSNDAYKEFLDS